MESSGEYTGGDPVGDPPGDGSVWAVAWHLIRFQAKLALDGLRDLVFSPLSLGAVLLGLIASPGDPGRYLGELMRLGRRSDRWINLFGEFDDEPSNADALVEPIERAARQRYQEALARRGGRIDTPDSEDG